MQRQTDLLLKPHPIQIARNRLPSPFHALIELLPVGRVRVGFGQDVAVAIFVERVLGWEAGGRDLGRHGNVAVFRGRGEKA